jgi:hypothetical protein
LAAFDFCSGVDPVVPVSPLFGEELGWSGVDFSGAGAGAEPTEAGGSSDFFSHPPSDNASPRVAPASQINFVLFFITASSWNNYIKKIIRRLEQCQRTARLA